MAKQKTPKYIFVMGGVLSGLGKGITAASIGNILKQRGLKVNIQKCDPYLNVDAGTLNPAEHGECFVTKDGAETDLDLGHYERFLDEELTQSSSLMSGRILKQVIEDERAGKYLGKTVQIIPHVTNAIQSEIEKSGEGFDVHIAEIGGTVGDYEGLAFIEAVRELNDKYGPQNCLNVYVVYLPYLNASGEIKTKPAQNAIRELRGLGITPNILVARSEDKAHKSAVDKLSMFSGVGKESIVLLPNAKTVYEVPLTLEKSGIGITITKKLSLTGKQPDMRSWSSLVRKAKTKYSKTVRIGLVAKYLENEDAYMSVLEALKSASIANRVGYEITWVNAEEVNQKNVKDMLSSFDGIVVPGGFGKRGIEGKIVAASYALTNDVPYLGLCLGMQVAAVAAARLAGSKDANTVEVDPNTPHPVIHIMPGQESLRGTGGTMRLGNYLCVFERNSKAIALYGKKTEFERHRHRYEFNNQYREQVGSVGISFSGLSPDKDLVELIEAKNHRFFMASQFHPEFRSRPNRPHPLFDGFIRSLKKRLN